ncbi:MAG: hypothetical protein A2Z21_07780 [Candidatus Fraserbacteria bacterium RBG_16_55_9]|uniref:Right handed beta helix domain-containing protein n=1 Tax=Fraserbacteria sp. (strain RBG_16_55_9) TaxID=1817864 RepID=A0A1F5V080_FRAXR|nr:MAG: hypothetical protein A2Z21_07780 [Candidatus Fraserbacteria bacterium RBG_16_55_9]
MRTALRWISTTLMCLMAWLLAGGALLENIQIEGYAQQACLPPNAAAGPDQSIFVGQTAQLDGGASSQSSSCTSSLIFAWSFVSRPSGSQAALSDAAVAKPTFVADVVGYFKLRLTVKNQAGSDADLITITSQREPRKINVPQDFSSIQAAIDAASAGDIVFIDAGTHSANLTISKPITLQGASRDATIISGDLQVPAVVITGTSDVAITDLTITRGSGGTGDSGRGGGLDISNSTVTMRNVVVRENLRHGLLADGSTLTLRDSQILNNQLSSDGQRGRGITLIQSIASIESTTVSGNAQDGILVAGDSVAEIVNSRISDNRSAVDNTFSRGVTVTDNGSVVIRDSAISGNGDSGVSLFNTANATIQDSTITNNSQVGIGMQDASRAVVENTQISQNVKGGIFMFHTTQAEIRKSTISNNEKLGLVLQNDSTVTLEQVTISGNKDTGLWALNQSKATIENSTITSNGFVGVDLASNSIVTLKGSKISENKNAGVVVRDDARATVIENTITTNATWGMWVEKAADLVECRGNTITGNSTDLNDVARLKCK